MNRLSFLKLMGLALVSVAVLPMQPFNTKVRLRLSDQRTYHTFKMSDGFTEEDLVECIKYELKSILEKYPTHIPTGIEFGYDSGDEFTPPDILLNIITCRITTRELI